MIPTPPPPIPTLPISTPPPPTLVTGAGRRLGQAIALALIDRGVPVAVHYHASADGAQHVLEHAERRGVRAVGLRADLGDSRQTEDLAAKAISALGGLGWLINSASIFEPLTAETTTLADWERHLRINLTAPFLLSTALARHLAGRPGVIVNLLDYRATRPGPDHFPYTISKAGLAAMTQSLAQAFAPELRVNGIGLGNVLPPADELIPKTPNFARTPAKRRATVAEVVETVWFLLVGPRYITGEIVHLDGGRHLT